MAQDTAKPLRHDEWTIIARSSALFEWVWENGHTPETMQAAGVVTMQRRVNGGFELVARLYNSDWRTIENWFKRHPIKQRAVYK